MVWRVFLTKQAIKDQERIDSSGLKTQVDRLIEVLKKNPFQNPPPYEKLFGNLAGSFSRRISIQHRLVYEVFKKEKKIKIIRMWTHYE